MLSTQFGGQTRTFVVFDGENIAVVCMIVFDGENIAVVCMMIMYAICYKRWCLRSLRSAE